MNQGGTNEHSNTDSQRAASKPSAEPQVLVRVCPEPVSCVSKVRVDKDESLCSQRQCPESAKEDVLTSLKLSGIGFLNV